MEMDDDRSDTASSDDDLVALLEVDQPHVVPKDVKSWLDLLAEHPLTALDSHLGSFAELNVRNDIWNAQNVHDLEGLFEEGELKNYIENIRITRLRPDFFDRPSYFGTEHRTEREVDLEYATLMIRVLALPPQTRKKLDELRKTAIKERLDEAEKTKQAQEELERRAAAAQRASEQRTNALTKVRDLLQQYKDSLEMSSWPLINVVKPPIADIPEDFGNTIANLDWAVALFVASIDLFTIGLSSSALPETSNELVNELIELCASEWKNASDGRGEFLTLLAEEINTTVDKKTWFITCVRQIISELSKQDGDACLACTVYACLVMRQRELDRDPKTNAIQFSPYGRVLPLPENGPVYSIQELEQNAHSKAELSTMRPVMFCTTMDVTFVFHVVREWKEMYGRSHKNTKFEQFAVRFKRIDPQGFRVIEINQVEDETGPKLLKAVRLGKEKRVGNTTIVSEMANSSLMFDAKGETLGKQRQNARGWELRLATQVVVKKQTEYEVLCELAKGNSTTEALQTPMVSTVPTAEFEKWFIKSSTNSQRPKGLDFRSWEHSQSSHMQLKAVGGTGPSERVTKYGEWSVRAYVGVCRQCQMEVTITNALVLFHSYITSGGAVQAKSGLSNFEYAYLMKHPFLTNATLETLHESIKKERLAERDKQGTSKRINKSLGMPLGMDPELPSGHETDMDEDTSTDEADNRADECTGVDAYETKMRTLAIQEEQNQRLNQLLDEIEKKEMCFVADQWYWIRLMSNKKRLLPFSPAMPYWCTADIPDLEKYLTLLMTARNNGWLRTEQWSGFMAFLQDRGEWEYSSGDREVENLPGINDISVAFGVLGDEVTDVSSQHATREWDLESRGDSEVAETNECSAAYAALGKMVTDCYGDDATIKDVKKMAIELFRRRNSQFFQLFVPGDVESDEEEEVFTRALRPARVRSLRNISEYITHDRGYAWCPFTNLVHWYAFKYMNPDHYVPEHHDNFFSSTAVPQTTMTIRILGTKRILRLCLKLICLLFLTVLGANETLPWYGKPLQGMSKQESAVISFLFNHVLISETTMVQFHIATFEERSLLLRSALNLYSQKVILQVGTVLDKLSELEEKSRAAKARDDDEWTSSDEKWLDSNYLHVGEMMDVEAVIFALQDRVCRLVKELPRKKVDKAENAKQWLRQLRYIQELVNAREKEDDPAAFETQCPDISNAEMVWAIRTMVKMAQKKDRPILLQWSIERGEKCDIKGALEHGLVLFPALFSDGRVVVVLADVKNRTLNVYDSSAKIYSIDGIKRGETTLETEESRYLKRITTFVGIKMSQHVVAHNPIQTNNTQNRPLVLAWLWKQLLDPRSEITENLSAVPIWVKEEMKACGNRSGCDRGFQTRNPAIQQKLATTSTRSVYKVGMLLDKNCHCGNIVSVISDESEPEEEYDEENCPLAKFGKWLEMYMALSEEERSAYDWSEQSEEKKREREGGKEEDTNQKPRRRTRKE
jgi:hypothetical protein